MNLLKKTNLEFGITDSLIEESPLGIHIETKQGILMNEKKLEDLKPTKKVIIYQSIFDTSLSAEHLSEITERILTKFPNFILSHRDPELTLYIKEILKSKGTNLQIATKLNESLEGDYLIYTNSKISNSRKRQIIELLNEKRKVILSWKAFTEGSTEVVKEIIRKSDTKQLILSGNIPRI